MKQFFVFCAVLLFASAALTQVNPYYYYDAMQSENAPTIDGVLDEIWENVPVEPIYAIVSDFNDPVDDEYDFSTNFRAMWKDDNFYVFVTVIDDELLMDEALATWQWDNIEIYFDADNSDGESAYDGVDDLQLRWTFNEEEIGDGIDFNPEWGFDPTLLEWGMAENDTGYTLEVRFPYDAVQLGGTIGEEFGFEFQVGDLDTDQANVFYRWNWNGGDSWRKTINHGTVVFVEDMVVPSSVGSGKAQYAERFELYQNYPNPFNPVTEIPFSLEYSGFVSLTVYNIRGETVATPVNDTWKSAGYHRIQFDAGDLQSGVYFYRLKTQQQIFTKKMLLTQ